MEKNLLIHNCAKVDTRHQTISKYAFSQEGSLQLGSSMEISQQIKSAFMVEKRVSWHMLFSGVHHHMCRVLVYRQLQGYTSAKQWVGKQEDWF